MDSNPALDRLVAIIALQNEIAAARLDLESVMDLVVGRAQSMTEATGAVVALREGDEFVYETVTGAYEEHKGLRRSIATGIMGLALRVGETFRCQDTEMDMRADRELCKRVGVRSLIVVPVKQDEEVVAGLQVCSDKPNAFAEGDINTLQLLAGLVGAALAQAEKFATLAEEGTWDSLTELGNLKAYQHRLAAEVARSSRYAMPISLVMLNVDGLDDVNDRFGHIEGDAVLRRVSSLIRQTRAADEIFRIGDNTFAILMPSTTKEGAELAAARIRNLVAAARLCDGLISMSFGVAQLFGDDSQVFHAEAYDALYEATLARSQEKAERANQADSDVG